MPTYSFEFPDGNNVDEIELVDAQEAWSQVVTTLAGMLKDIDGNLPADADWEIKVRDGEGTEFASIRIVASRSQPLANS